MKSRDDMSSVTMRSNSGWYETSILPRKSVGGGVICELSVRGQFWDRGQDLMNAELVPERTVQFHQVEIGHGPMREMLECVMDWLKSGKLFSLNLATDQDQLEFSLKAALDGGEPSEKPLFVGRYAFGNQCCFEWSYIVDQSCVKMLQEELSGFLVRYAETE